MQTFSSILLVHRRGLSVCVLHTVNYCWFSHTLCFLCKPITFLFYFPPIFFLEVVWGYKNHKKWRKNSQPSSSQKHHSKSVLYKGITADGINQCSSAASHQQKMQNLLPVNSGILAQLCRYCSSLLPNSSSPGVTYIFVCQEGKLPARFSSVLLQLTFPQLAFPRMTAREGHYFLICQDLQRHFTSAPSHFLLCQQARETPVRQQSKQPTKKMLECYLSLSSSSTPENKV